MGGLPAKRRWKPGDAVGAACDNIGGRTSSVVGVGLVARVSETLMWTVYDGDGMNDYPINSPWRGIDATLWTNVRIASTSARKFGTCIEETLGRR